MVYQSGQVKSIFPYVHPGIKHFVLGGPADGDEAQVFHEEFPDVSIHGFEPNQGFFDYQLSHDFPGSLRQAALAEAPGKLPFYIMGEKEGRSSRLVASHTPAYEVDVVTIDSLGLNEPTVLWLDIERAELRALQGASRMLSHGLIDVVLLEVLPDTETPVVQFLRQYNIFEVERVNVHGRYDDAGRDEDYRYDGIYRRIGAP